MASQSPDEVASGGREDVESTALTSNLNEELYSNPGATAGHICFHSGHFATERLERFAHVGGHV